MDFGDPVSLRRLARTLKVGATDTAQTVSRTHSTMETLPDRVSAYERRSAYGFQRSWLRAHKLLSTITSGSDEIADAVDVLANRLDRAQDDWQSAYLHAVGHGFTVHLDGAASTVTADGDNHHELAAHFQTQLRTAAEDADRARSIMRRCLQSLDTSDVHEFGAGREAVIAPATGDPSLDTSIRTRCALLMGVHQQIANHRAGR